MGICVCCINVCHYQMVKCHAIHSLMAYAPEFQNGLTPTDESGQFFKK